MRNIGKIIEAGAQRFKGKLGVGYKDLQTGEEYFYNGSRKFYMASTFKLFVLIAFYERVMKGELDEDTVYTVQDSDYISSSTFLHPYYPRRDFKLSELAMLMMILSDNASTDIIWKHTGAENIARIVKETGSMNTTVTKDCKAILSGYYNILDTDSDEEIKRKMTYSDEVTDRDNISTPSDVTHVFELLYNNRILNEKYCRRILEIMSCCLLNARMPSFFPIDGYAAHKTGTIDGYTNDVGIVFTPKGNYVLVFYCTSPVTGNMARSVYGEEFLATLSREIYDAFVENAGER